MGGGFTSLMGQVRANVGRLINTDAATQSLSLNGSTLHWLRSGTCPEVWTTTFESSTDGANWTLLGAGMRVAGGWQLNGVSVPGGAQVRARGFVTGGAWNASSWFVESRATFGSPRPFLTITRLTPETVVIAWPSPSTGWNLQQNGTPADGTWMTPPEPISDDGITKSITVNSPAGSRFFRLAQ